MTLPEHGWKGYGSPQHPWMRVTRAADSLRRAAIANDDALHANREAAFARWCAETVFPASVNRWIADIGARA